MNPQLRFDFNSRPCQDMSPMLTPPAYDPGPVTPAPWDPDDLTPEERHAEARYHAEAWRFASIDLPPTP